jgi:hypothetical protein
VQGPHRSLQPDLLLQHGELSPQKLLASLRLRVFRTRNLITQFLHTQLIFSVKINSTPKLFDLARLELTLSADLFTQRR